MFFYGVNAYFYNSEQQQQQQQQPQRLDIDESSPTLKTMTMKWAHEQHRVDNLKIMAILIRFYGGNVAVDKRDSTITHIIMQEDQNETDIAIAAGQFGR